MKPGGEVLFTQVILNCRACQDTGHPSNKIGNMFQMAGQHSRAGDEPRVDARCTPRFSQRANGGRTLTVTCSRGHRPQVAWDDILTVFRGLHPDGVSQGRMTI